MLRGSKNVLERQKVGGHEAGYSAQRPLSVKMRRNIDFFFFFVEAKINIFGGQPLFAMDLAP